LAAWELDDDEPSETKPQCVRYNDCIMDLYTVPAEGLIKALKRKFPDVRIIL